MSIQNMYMTPLNYTNFAGAKKSTKLHFHITPVEFADWMMDNKAEADKMLEALSGMEEAMEANPNGEATEAQKLTMLRLIRTLAEISYGKPSDDGEVFDKSETEKFRYSAAYAAFRMFLFENQKEMLAFFQTLLNEDVIKEFSSRIAASAGDPAQPQLQSVPAEKDPSLMTREELLEAMKKRNQQ